MDKYFALSVYISYYNAESTPIHKPIINFVTRTIATHWVKLVTESQVILTLCGAKLIIEHSKKRLQCNESLTRSERLTYIAVIFNKVASCKFWLSTVNQFLWLGCCRVNLCHGCKTLQNVKLIHAVSKQQYSKIISTQPLLVAWCLFSI